NYISVIDGRHNELLQIDDQPVVIATDFFCTDLLLVERDPAFNEVDELFLYVANEYRGSVMKYSIDILRGLDDEAVNVVVNPPPAQDAHFPHAEILGVGKNPYRLHL